MPARVPQPLSPRPHLKRVVPWVIAMHVVALLGVYLICHVRARSRPREIAVAVTLVPAPPAPTAAEALPPAAAAEPRTTTAAAATAVRSPAAMAPAAATRTRPRYRTPDEIRASVSRPPVAPAAPPQTAPDATTVAARLRERLGSAAQPAVAATRHRQDYHAQVHGALYNRWRQPGAAALGNRRHDVTVRLQIAADGRVTAAGIVAASGNVPLDSSVRQLLADLPPLPPLPETLAAPLLLEVKLEVVP
jgi:TonB family protein